jgi:hypothetical protein
MAQPKISKPQSKTHTLKIIAIVAAFVMGGLMLYMNAMILYNISLLMELEQKHYGLILRNTNIINYKITNDEESRQLLKDFYDIDYKKD